MRRRPVGKGRGVNRLIVLKSKVDLQEMMVRQLMVLSVDSWERQMACSKDKKTAEAM